MITWQTHYYFNTELPTREAMVVTSGPSHTSWLGSGSGAWIREAISQTIPKNSSEEMSGLLLQCLTIAPAKQAFTNLLRSSMIVCSSVIQTNIGLPRNTVQNKVEGGNEFFVLILYMKIPLCFSIAGNIYFLFTKQLMSPNSRMYILCMDN